LRTWKKFTIACFSAVFVLCPSGWLNGCGADFYEDYEGYYSSYFAPEVFGLENYRPLFYSGNRLYDYAPFAENYEEDTSGVEENYFPGREKEQQENVQDWRGYFKNAPKAEDIKELVYEADSATLIALNNYLNGKAGKAEKALVPKNSLTSFLRKKRKQYPDFIPYLLYVRACSPYVSGNGKYWDWEAEEEVEEEAKNLNMKSLLDQGLKAYRNTTSDFMKLRYGYQAVRLAHYLADYELANYLYNTLVEPLKINSPVRYWALSHKAGALLSSGNQEEALYQFAVVYANSPARRVEAYQGFQQFGGGVCETCFSFAKTNQEKSAIWLLKGLTYETTPLNFEAMVQIYALDPKSENLELLLSRELNKMEEEVYEAEQNGTTKAPKSIPGLDLTLHFVQKMAEKEDILRPFVWQFGAGYLAYLKQDYALANTYFAKIKQQQTKNELLLDQVNLLELVQKYEKPGQVTPEKEKAMLEDIQWLEGKEKSFLRTYRAKTFVYEAIANAYKMQGDEVKYALTNSGRGFRGQTDYYFYEKMIAYLRRPGTSGWEQFLLKKYPFTVNDLLNSQARILISNYQFREAIAKYDQVSADSAIDKLMADPFKIRINDCHDCDYTETGNVNYNGRSFAKRMTELIELVRKDPANAWRYHFLLGNAYYNLTYFGNAWYAAAFERTSEIPDQVKREPYRRNSYNNFNTISCLPAELEYEQALKLAPDKEFASKVAFMAAKCEQNRYYISPDFNRQEDPHALEKYRRNFRLLKQQYSNTKYYREVIKDCTYFAEYVRKGK
jgi:hypothetical protein